MNKKMLKSIMVMHGEQMQDLAKLLDIDVQTVMNKINEKQRKNGKSEFKQGEILAIAKHYNMTDAQLIACFFTR